MGKKTIGIISMALIAFTIIYLMVFNTRESNTGKIKLLNDRNYTQTLFLTKSFETNKDLALIKKYDNHLYFSSWADCKIYKYDFKIGKIVDSIGSKGEGPTENLLIMNYDIEGNVLTTIDARKGTIQSVNTLNDSSIFYFKYPKHLSRSVKIQNKYLFTQSDHNQKLVFETFDINNKTIEQVDTKRTNLEHIEMSSFTHDGIFAKNRYGAAYVTFASNKIYFFNENLKFQFQLDMIYQLPEPKFITTKNGSIFPDKNNINSIKSIFLDEKNNLYLVSIVDDLGNYTNSRVIDVYDLKEKKYSHSIKLFEVDGYLPNEIYVEDQKVFVKFDEKIIGIGKFEAL